MLLKLEGFTDGCECVPYIEIPLEFTVFADGGCSDNHEAWVSDGPIQVSSVEPCGIKRFRFEFFCCGDIQEQSESWVLNWIPEVPIIPLDEICNRNINPPPMVLFKISCDPLQIEGEQLALSPAENPPVVLRGVVVERPVYWDCNQEIGDCEKVCFPAFQTEQECDDAGWPRNCRLRFRSDTDNDRST